ncbi:TIGR03564 family F420-dependent LLM class oxidoreductase [Nocardia sp. NPDC019395]|uniref:TIGR03564 family F420-dependent LLM class oxidoreductase n=1 Tax=Nocardia sp. NPDC019395 TaxID=3154686 RepID=UPI0033E0727D
MALNAPVGIALSPHSAAANAVDDVIERARFVQQTGIDRVWFAQRFDFDSLSLAAVVGSAVPGLHIGTSVVPINPRHPLVVASQAQTAHAASHRRFTLGLGLGARALEEPAFGVAADRPIRRLREYLTVLRSVLTTGTVDFTGDTVTAAPPLPATVAGGDGPDIVVAAMGPQALTAAGELSDGIVPFLAGPRALGDDIVPRVEAAAGAAGRPRPRVIAGVAVVVTADPDRVRARAAEQMAFYDAIPSYRSVLDREGVASAAELVVIGTEAEVEAQLRRYIDAGATELLITQTDLGGDEDERATWRFLGSLSAPHHRSRVSDR